MIHYTNEQKAQHCEQLAALLETVHDDQFDLSLFATGYKAGEETSSWEHKAEPQCGTIACAIGWAALHGIAGMHIDFASHVPCHPDNTEEVGTFSWSDDVFGPGAWDTIFSCGRMYYAEHGVACPYTLANGYLYDPADPNTWLPDHEYPDGGRQGSIELLRQQAAKLREDD